jgi:hypothetical protein
MQHPLWHKIPLVRLLIPLVCGIGVSMFVEWPFLPVFFLALFFVCLMVCIQMLLKRYVHRWMFGVVVNACVFTVGLSLHLHSNELLNVVHYSHAIDAQYVWVKIEEEPIAKTSSYKMVATVVSIEDSCGNHMNTIGELLVYIGKEGVERKVSYGNVLRIPYAKITPIPGPQNPDEFDYKRYLAFKQIYFQVYLKPDECVWATSQLSNPLMSWVYRVQHYFKGVLTRCINSPAEAGVAEALVYGYDDDIDGETMQAYACWYYLHDFGLVVNASQQFEKRENNQASITLGDALGVLLNLWIFAFYFTSYGNVFFYHCCRYFEYALQCIQYLGSLGLGIVVLRSKHLGQCGLPVELYGCIGYCVFSTPYCQLVYCHQLVDAPNLVDNGCFAFGTAHHVSNWFIVFSPIPQLFLVFQSHHHSAYNTHFIRRYLVISHLFLFVA